MVCTATVIGLLLIALLLTFVTDRIRSEVFADQRDVILADAVTLAALRTRLPSAVAVSARTGEGIEELRARIEQMLPHPQVSIDVVVPYSRGDLVSRVHAEGEIDTVDYVETGTRVVARVGAALAAEIEGAATSASAG